MIDFLDNLLEEIVPYFMHFVFFIIIPVFTVFAVFSVISAVKSEKILLLKNEWECSNTKTYWTPVLIGKSTIMQPQTMCVEYRRK